MVTSSESRVYLFSVKVTDPVTGAFDIAEQRYFAEGRSLPTIIMGEPPAKMTAGQRVTLNATVSGLSTMKAVWSAPDLSSSIFEDIVITDVTTI